MQLKILSVLLIMFGWYPEYAKAQGRDIYEQKGIILYELDQSEIPIYVFFAPVILHNDKSVTMDLEKVFDDKDTKFYILYFQAIRWIKPNIAEFMKELKYASLKYGNIQRPMRLTYASLLFDRTYKSEMPDSIKTIVVPVKFDGHTYSLTVLTDWPKDYGTLKDISPLDDRFNNEQ